MPVKTYTFIDDFRLSVFFYSWAICSCPAIFHSTNLLTIWSLFTLRVHLTHRPFLTIRTLSTVRLVSTQKGETVNNYRIVKSGRSFRSTRSAKSDHLLYDPSFLFSKLSTLSGYFPTTLMIFCTIVAF